MLKEPKNLEHAQFDSYERKTLNSKTIFWGCYKLQYPIPKTYYLSGSCLPHDGMWLERQKT